MRDALQHAVDHIIEADAIDQAERPEVDHDTLNEPGSPDIARTINRKIAGAAVFVADMTPIAETDPQALRSTTPADQLPAPKYLQNPNVMIELGYADRAIGRDRIMLIVNAPHYPGPEALPFDWRHRPGPITYRHEAGASPREVERVRARLAEEIAAALPPMLAAAALNQPARAPILTLAPSNVDPALWAGGERGVWFNASSIQQEWSTAHLAEGPRLFVRLRAERWPGAPRQELGRRIIGSDVRLWIGDGGGSSGLNGDGAFSASQIDEIEPDIFSATGFTQWFSDDGEIWAVNRASFWRNGNQLYFSAASPFG